MPFAEIDTFADCLQQIAEAEAEDGWLIACEGRQQYLVSNREMLAALNDALNLLAEHGPVLEVCAGRGELAKLLNASGSVVSATDVASPAGTDVEPLAALDALQRYRPRVVLSAFAPVDSGVDAMVFSCSSVKYYVVLHARMGDAFGSSALWASAWKSQRLEQVTRWMLTRHDVWLGAADLPLIQHGEAWLFSRPSSEVDQELE